MITLVTGGSGSGKSEYAERLILRSSCGTRYYVATMIPYGKEGKDKVLRHRMLRQGKGFITLEQPGNVGGLVLERPGASMPEQPGVPVPAQPGTALLLECVSNLAANEMFGGEGGAEQGLDVEGLAAKIEKDIMCLARQVRDLVIVTNEVDRDGNAYEEGTMDYIRLMGRINQRLSRMADQVVEVVYGIPVMWKPLSVRHVPEGLDLRKKEEGGV